MCRFVARIRSVRRSRKRPLFSKALYTLSALKMELQNADAFAHALNHGEGSPDW